MKFPKFFCTKINLPFNSFYHELFEAPANIQRSKTEMKSCSLEPALHFYSTQKAQDQNVTLGNLRGRRQRENTFISVCVCACACVCVGHNSLGQGSPLCTYGSWINEGKKHLVKRVERGTETTGNREEEPGERAVVTLR